MNLRAMSFPFCVLMLCITGRAFASVPPEYKELTRAEMRSLGFKFAIKRDNVSSSIDLRFPKHVLVERFRMIPHTTDIVVKNTAGQVLATATNWISGNDDRSLDTSYNHKVSDVTVTVTYACEKARKDGCYGATRLRILSVSSFIVSNPDAVNLLPKCRKVTSLVIDCTQYESAEHP